MRFKFIQIKGFAFFQGGGGNENILTKFKQNFLQNHWFNFNQTWLKASLDEEDSTLFKWKATRFSKGRL